MSTIRFEGLEVFFHEPNVRQSRLGIEWSIARYLFHGFEDHLYRFFGVRFWGWKWQLWHVGDGRGDKGWFLWKLQEDEYQYLA